MKVRCPSCKRCCHTITASFDPDVRPNGGMLELMDPWKSWGWGKFGEGTYGGPSVMASDMLCVLCQAPLAPAGRLHVVDDDYQEVPKPKTLEQLNQERIDAEFSQEDDEPIAALTYKCPVCGWDGKTEPALKRHMTMRHG